MSLYQKYRPKTLEEMYGNAAVINGLKEHFNQDPSRVSHAHIISGSSGCGKTTIARAVAKSILGADDMTIHEINSAENRGIDTAREIIEQMKHLPLGGGASVYILDEVHGLTADAKRSFLKPLEDCPKHVYFFLCTTDLNKFLKDDAGKAINTRCTKWKVEPLDVETSCKLVDDVLVKENADVTDDVFKAIVDVSEGSPRALLVNLEKVLSIKDEKDQLKVLKDCGAVDDDPDSRRLSEALLKGDLKLAMSVLTAFKGKCDPEQIRRGVLGYMTTILLKSTSKVNGRAYMTLNAFSEPTYDNGFPGLLLNTLRALGEEC